ncbi:MAG: S-layer homology domain-containing protein [Clostridia bacterium]|nr:S-layer homology domain-containing protein [Clostridia bacterium]
MKIRFLSLLLALTMLPSLCAVEPLSVSAENYSPGATVDWNDHTYHLYDESMTWEEAKVYCENSGGHLVTITSEEEQQIVEQLLDKGLKKQYWIGLSKTSGGMKWVNEEELTYTNWDKGEPNGSSAKSGQHEQYVHIYNLANPAVYGSKRFKWNDMYNDNTYPREEEFFSLGNVGFICEWERESAGFDFKKHGWTIMNNAMSFSYPTPYLIPTERYYEVFNDVKAFFIISTEGWKTLFGQYWGGNCFGLSASAILNYEDKIDLKQYFSKEGNNLNSYGYDYQTEHYNALSESNKVISLIERMQISQMSDDFDSIEVFKTGDHKEKIKQLIDYLNKENPTPLVVAIYDDGGHALVTDTSVKPEKVEFDGNEDFYKITLYDPNKPHSSTNLEVPLNGYKSTSNYLYVNPKTGEWQYNMMDKWWGDTKNYLLAGNSTLRLYDVTKYSDKFLKKNLKIKPNNNKTYAYVSADEININDNAFCINTDGKISTDNVEYTRYCSSSTTDNFVGKVIVDTNNISVNEMKDTDIVFVTKEDCISVSVDDESSYSVDTNINQVTLNASENATFDIVIDNESDTNFNAVRIKGTASDGKTTISVTDNGVIEVDGGLKDFDAEVTVGSDQNEIKTFKCTDITELSGYTINNMDESTSFGSVVSQWAKEEVEEAYDENLVPDVLVGKDLTQKVDRAEFAAIAVALYENLTGSKAIKSSNPFNDIHGNACEDDILKAYNLDITTGTSATTFDPSINITREQMATMLTRAYKKSEFKDWSITKDADYPLNFMGVQRFADDNEISDYAKESVYFMARWDIIKGVGDNKFAPKNSATLDESYGYATREQAVIIALRSAKHL